MGIKTGCNEAFLIDSTIRKELLQSNSNSHNIIFPYLRGQDISRWSATRSNLWMITLKSSSDHAWPWSESGDKAEADFRQTYPAIHHHLKRFETSLVNRVDRGRYWWELRACSYWNEFGKPKILYQDITWKPNFCLDEGNSLSNNTTYFLPACDYWTLAVLNSPLAWWFSWRKAQHAKDEALRFFTVFVESFPIANPTDVGMEEVERIARRLIDLKTRQEQVRVAISDWLRVEFEIVRHSASLKDLFHLDAEGFLDAVRACTGGAKQLTVAALKRLRDEYDCTVLPALDFGTNSIVLENRLHDLVNSAYGLTHDEVRLMWDTAPPRMPIPRPASV